MLIPDEFLCDKVSYRDINDIALQCFYVPYAHKTDTNPNIYKGESSMSASKDQVELAHMGTID